MLGNSPCKSWFLLPVAGLAIAVAIAVPGEAAAGTLYSTEFTDLSGWTTSGDVHIDGHTYCPDSECAHLSTYTAQAHRTVSTAGSTGIELSWTIKPHLLEGPDHCYVEYNTGSGWQVLRDYGAADDGQSWTEQMAIPGTDDDDNPGFQVRIRLAATTADHCAVSDFAVLDGGGGGGSRTELTHGYLVNGPESSQPVSSGAFAIPGSPTASSHTFEGSLILGGEATGGQFTEIRDDFLYTNLGDSPMKHLPEIDYEFVQDGFDLIPVLRGKQLGDHLRYDIILEPGKVWQEAGDNGLSRAALPFYLTQRGDDGSGDQYGANCTFNGMLSFLFDDTSISRVHYQITQETCLYFKFDMWGLLDATYDKHAVTGAAQVKSDFAAEVANRLPTRPFQELAIDYPGIDLSRFGTGSSSGLTAEHVTSYGVYVDGILYIGECRTRYGNSPFCDVMVMPSYSLAKSIFVSTAMMAVEHKHSPAGGINNLIIDDHDVTGTGTWNDVTFNHASDMATGNYKFAGNMQDESSSTMNGFFLADSEASRDTTAYAWSRKATPGTTWVYHTSDTYILRAAIEGYLATTSESNPDLFDFLRAEVLEPLDVSPTVFESLRTSDSNWNGVALGGYGMWFKGDDLTKIANMLHGDDGAIGGVQVLDPDMLDDAMQDDPGDRGLDTTGLTPYKYNNGFWARRLTSSEISGLDCSEVYTPFMSGYGGINVYMFKGSDKVVVWYVGDNDEVSAMANSGQEIHDHIGSVCN